MVISSRETRHIIIIWQNYLAWSWKQFLGPIHGEGGELPLPLLPLVENYSPVYVGPETIILPGFVNSASILPL